MNNSISKSYTNNTRNAISNGYRSTRNATVRTFNNFRESSLFVQIIIVIIIILVLILLFFWIRHLWEMAKYESQESPFLVTEPINAFKQNGQPVVRKRVPFPVDGLAFTYSMWIYVADWNYNFGKYKPILVKESGNLRSPGLWLYPNTNTLHARISTTADANEGCDVPDIPLQKWVHIVYILNNRSVDIYIDGKLTRSCALRGVPTINNSQVEIASDGGFYGQIAKTQYFTRALVPSEVALIYSEGPFLSTKFKLPFFSDNKKSSSNDDNDSNNDSRSDVYGSANFNIKF